jgi:hypothetical protein
VRDWRYWRDTDYWLWRWRRLGREGRAVLAVVGSVVFGAVGYVLASGLASDASAGPGTAYETTVLRTLTATHDGRTVTQVVPEVRTVHVASARTSLATTTQSFLRTVTTPGGTRVVTDSVTTTVPVVRRVLVTGPADTRTRVVTSERTNVETRTQTQTVTVARTQTVASPPVTQTETRTQTQTVTVTQPPVTQTTTVTQPAVTVTISVPELP